MFGQEDMLKTFLEHYRPTDALEIAERESFIQFMKIFGEKAYFRENLIGHVCASCWIMNPPKTKVLMIYHNLYQSWGWIGGHADGRKNLLAVALSEAKEESGITNLQLGNTSPIDINILGVKAHVKNGKIVPAHLHFNVVYVLRGDEHQPLRIKPDENKGVQWIEIEKINEYCTEAHMLPLYKRLLEKVKKMG